MENEKNQGKTPRTFILGSRYRVAVVGGNFAGMKAASALADQFKTTVIDPGPWFEFLPNIHELLSGVKKPGNLRLPRESLIKGFGADFLNDAVTEIEPEKKRIKTAGGKRIYYDFCIVAVGGVNNTFGIEGAEKHAMPFKSVDDCHNIGRKLKELAGSGKKVTAVIVGGGLEGIEALGETLRKYGKTPGFKIELIEKSDRLLPSFVSSLDKEIRRLCADRDVVFRTGTGVEKVTPEHVFLTSGEKIESDITIWTGGAVAPALLRRSGLCDKAGQWAPVRQTCQSHCHDDIFVAGDAAALPAPVSKQAYYAMDMGTLAALNIHRLANGDNPVDFKPYFRPAVVTFGNLSTFMIFEKLALAGSALAGIKESIFQITMARMDTPIRLGAYFDAFGRVKSSASGFVFPTLTSFSALKRLGGVRLLV